MVFTICEHDVFGMGLPLHHVRRTIEESGLPFDDKSSIIYVNDQIQDETPLGRLMHDLSRRDAKDMHYIIGARDSLPHFL